MGRRVVAVAGLLAVGSAAALGACGESGPSVSPGLVASDYEGRFEVVATVLDDSDGPELCAGGVEDSLPPGCSGPPVAGWDWSVVEHESASGVRWGTYALVGTWDGETFTLTEPAAAPDTSEDGDLDDPVTVPCEPPPGGFDVPDPSRATMEDFLAATEALRTLPDLGYLAVEQSGGYPGATVEPTGIDGVLPPEDWVLVLTTTGDIDQAEAAAREFWGGPLCVAPARRTEAELRAVLDAITGSGSGDGVVEDFLYAGVDGTAEQVELGVLVATEELQQRLDAEFGDGVVRLEGALQPVD